MQDNASTCTCNRRRDTVAYLAFPVPAKRGERGGAHDTDDQQTPVPNGSRVGGRLDSARRDGAAAAGPHGREFHARLDRRNLGRGVARGLCRRAQIRGEERDQSLVGARHRLGLYGKGQGELRQPAVLDGRRVAGRGVVPRARRVPAGLRPRHLHQLQGHHRHRQGAAARRPEELVRAACLNDHGVCLELQGSHPAGVVSGAGEPPNTRAASAFPPMAGSAMPGCNASTRHWAATRTISTRRSLSSPIS